MALYLLGIFMGAIDTGIITPARTVIQSQLGVDEATGLIFANVTRLAAAPNDVEQALDRLMAIASAAAALSGEED